MVKAVTMVKPFGNDATSGGIGNNNNTIQTPKVIVSIHLANCGNKCSNNDDRSAAPFESTANDHNPSSSLSKKQGFPILSI